LRVLYCDKPFLRWRCPGGSTRHERLSVWGEGAFKCSKTSWLDTKTWIEDPFYQLLVIVEQYTGRKAPFPKDILPALSGLTRHIFGGMQTANMVDGISNSTPPSESDYLAGHWKQDLKQSLLWGRSIPRDRLARGPYTAPTWSWASFAEEHVSFVYDDEHFPVNCCCVVDRQSGDWCVEVLEAEVVLSTSDPFGRVSGGKLVICGPVTTFPWLMTKESVGDFSSRTPRKSSDYPIRHTTPMNYFEEKPQWRVGRPATPPIARDFPTETHKRNYENWAKDLHFPDIELDWDCYLPSNCMVFRMNNVAGILLEPVTKDSVPHTYQRIGLCKGIEDNDYNLDFDFWKGWKKEVITII
jgi:hypothetical protein